MFARRTFWLLPLGVYVVTGSRTPGWADAALIARNVHNLDLQIWVNNHNLFTLVAAGWVKILPDSVELAYALNLLCALLGALTVQVVFLIGLRLTANLTASALGALVLMLSHSLWWHSTMLEVYTLSTLLLALTVLFVLRYEQGGALRDLCGAVFFFGLGCSNHAQMSLLLFGFLAILLESNQRRTLLRWQTLTLLAVSFLLGFQVYAWVFAFELVGRLDGLADPAQALASTLGAMVHETTGGGFRQYMFPSGLSFGERSFWWLFFLGLFVYSFPSMAILLGPLGVWTWLRSGRDRVTLRFVTVALVAELIWASNYFVWDMYAFSLPVYTLFAILVIIGIDWVCRRSRQLRVLFYLATPTLFISPLLYAQAPGWLAASDRANELLQTLPQYGQATTFWDPLPYFFDPNKRGFDRVERYAEDALRRIDTSACYWGDEAKLLYPLKYYYQEALGRRPDVRYELIFAILEGDREFQAHAIAMIRQLRSGCSVYVESLGYPERDVLNHVYEALDARTSAATVARLSEEAFMRSFPYYQFEAVKLDESDPGRIYRLRRRTRPSPTEP
jgi:hypothetical protein